MNDYKYTFEVENLNDGKGLKQVDSLETAVEMLSHNGFIRSTTFFFVDIAPYRFTFETYSDECANKSVKEIKELLDKKVDQHRFANGFNK